MRLTDPYIELHTYMHYLSEITRSSCLYLETMTAEVSEVSGLTAWV